MSDILIVGGGIIGLLTARELALSGEKVTVVDKHGIGTESSWAGGGILSPLYPWRYTDPVTSLASWGQRIYPELIEDLKIKTGLDPELEHSGLLIIEPSEIEPALAWAKKWQQKMEIIEAHAIEEIEPALAKQESEKAIWLPEVKQVRNPRFVKSLRKYLELQGVKVKENVHVTDFIIKDNQVCGVKTPEGELLADKVVVAGGAWSADLLQKLNVAIKVEPVKGQMILFKTNPGSIKRIVLSQDRYVIPRRDGRVLVGSSLEYAGFDKSTSEQVREELCNEAIRIIPELEKANVEHHWAGLRPGSPDGIPYICAHPEFKGLYINSGHFRNGVVLGPASARLMADIVLQRETILNTDNYQCSR